MLRLWRTRSTNWYIIRAIVAKTAKPSAANPIVTKLANKTPTITVAITAKMIVFKISILIRPLCWMVPPSDD